MQNQEIVKMIDNLKGRRGYEEKRASKLGFASLYAYFEDKISKKLKTIEDKQKELEVAKAEDLQLLQLLILFVCLQWFLVSLKFCLQNKHKEKQSLI